jgi:hypothetical protein
MTELTTKPIEIQCVLIDTSDTPHLYLESDLGEGKASYWTDYLSKAFVFNSLSEALPVFSKVTRNGNVEIKELVECADQLS